MLELDGIVKLALNSQTSVINFEIQPPMKGKANNCIVESVFSFLCLIIARDNAPASARIAFIGDVVLALAITHYAHLLYCCNYPGS